MQIGFIYAIAAAITWGVVYTLDEKILTRVTPLAFLFIYSLVSALIMLPFLFFSNDSIKALLNSGKTNLLLMLSTVVLGLLASFFILSGIKNLNASTASIIEISYPFFVVLFSYLIFRSAPNLYFFVGGILIFAGSFIIIKFAS